jgi:hypothetical protein
MGEVRVMTLSILEAADPEELRVAAIARFVAGESGQQVFRIELARCGLTAATIDEVIREHLAERRRRAISEPRSPRSAGETPESVKAKYGISDETWNEIPNAKR